MDFNDILVDMLMKQLNELFDPNSTIDRVREMELQPIAAPLSFEENMRLLMRRSSPNEASDDGPAMFLRSLEEEEEECDDGGEVAATEEPLDLGAEFAAPDVLSLARDLTSVLRLSPLLPSASLDAAADEVLETLRSPQFAQVANQFAAGLGQVGQVGRALSELGWRADIVAATNIGIEAFFETLERHASPEDYILRENVE